MSALNPAARLLWRDHRSVQLELGERAVLVEGVDTPAVRRLLGAAAPAGGHEPGLAQVVAELEADGYLWPVRAGADEPAHPPYPRLAGELAARGARHGPAAGALLSARTRAQVGIVGDGRAGPLLAALLAAAGVGRVHLSDPGRVRLRHLLPGGPRPTDEGLPLAQAAARAVRRAAPEVDTRAPAPDDEPDLVLLATDEPVDHQRHEALHRRAQPHLVVGVGPDSCVIGPLVVPGRTACLRCADLHRLDRDPAWTALAVQLSSPPPHGRTGEVALAVIAAGVASMQALAFLDGEVPASVDGTLEMHPPDWRLRRRSWPPHPDCRCRRP